MPRTSLLAAVCAVVLLAAGCTPDDPKPNYSSVSTTPTTASPSPATSSTSPSVPSSGPNSSPGEAPPTVPLGANASSAEAAQAFEAYYIKLVDWVYATSEPRILDPLYDPACTNCNNFVSNLTKQVAGGSTFHGSRISIRRLALVTNDGRSEADFAVSVEIDATALEIRDSEARVTDRGPATTLTLTNWLRWSDGSWVIVDQGKA